MVLWLLRQNVVALVVVDVANADLLSLSNTQERKLDVCLGVHERRVFSTYGPENTLRV